MNISIEQRAKLRETWNVLSAAKFVVISTHIDPDGDAIGSALGLYHLLQQNGIDSIIINHSPTPHNLQFLPDSQLAIISGNQPELHSIIQKADMFCVLDLNVVSRLGVSVIPLFANFSKQTILFDHHVHPDIPIEISNSIVSASSTCEIIATMAQEAKLILQENAAMCLYTGLMTDTGGFRHPRTNAEVMHLAAWLIECGANPVRIYDSVMNANSPESMVLLGRALTSLSFSDTKEIALIVLPKEQLSGFSPEDTEGFVNYTLSIKGVKIGGLITEWDGGLIKISMRGKPEYNVRQIAEHFGGGGHLQAAGARTINESLESVVEKVMILAEQSLHSSL